MDFHRTNVANVAVAVAVANVAVNTAVVPVAVAVV